MAASLSRRRSAGHHNAVEEKNNTGIPGKGTRRKKREQGQSWRKMGQQHMTSLDGVEFGLC